MKIRRSLAVATLAAAAGLLATRAAHQAPTPAGPVTSTQRTVAQTPSGRYALEFASEQTARVADLGEQALSASLRLRGALSIARGEAGALALRLTGGQVDEAHLSGQPLAGLQDVFAGAEGATVSARYDPRGVFAGLDVPDAVREAGQGVFQQLGATLQGLSATGNHREATPLGAVQATGSVEGDTHVRRRDAYTAVTPAGIAGLTSLRVESGETRWTYDAAGRLATLEHTEHTVGRRDDGVVVLDETLHITLRRLGDATRDDALAAMPRRSVAVGGLAPDRDAERQMLATAAAGLTPEALVQQLLAFASAGTMPDHGGFLYRAAALLRLDPAAARAAGAAFAQMPAASPGRTLVLDLLAQVNTDAAQAVLVSLLESPEATDDPAYGLHVQRAGLAADPGPQVVEFAQTFAEDPPEGLETAAAYTLGAVAGNVARRGGADDRALGLALAEPLRARLDAAEAPAERALALRALGNVGAPELLEDIEPFTRAPEAEVRQAAAAAMRRVDTPEGRAALVAMLGDASPDVAMEALRNLTDMQLTEADLAGLAALAEAPALSDDLAEMLVNAASFHRDSPAARKALGRLGARVGVSARLRARIDALLG
jgi:YD repeat-containing protein